MKNIKEIITEEIQRQVEIRESYQKQLSKLPKGRLSVASGNRSGYYSKILGKKKKYIGKIDHPEVEVLQKRYYLEESIKRINGNVTYMEKLQVNFKPIGALDILSSAPKAYKDFSGANNLLARDWVEEQWERADYNKNTTFPEGLIHRTAKGEYVRSKSEVLLANLLYSNGIPYRYEEMREVGGHRVAPDFTIFVVRKNKVILWEHFGMINDIDYLYKCMEKIQRYLSNGYKLWEDLIITFDSVDKSIDTQLMEKIIDTFLK